MSRLLSAPDFCVSAIPSIVHGPSSMKHFLVSKTENCLQTITNIKFRLNLAAKYSISSGILYTIYAFLEFHSLKFFLGGCIYEHILCINSHGKCYMNSHYSASMNKRF